MSARNRFPRHCLAESVFPLLRTVPAVLLVLLFTAACGEAPGNRETPPADGGSQGGVALSGRVAVTGYVSGTTVKAVDPSSPESVLARTRTNVKGEFQLLVPARSIGHCMLLVAARGDGSYRDHDQSRKWSADEGVYLLHCSTNERGRRFGLLIGPTSTIAYAAARGLMQVGKASSWNAALKKAESLWYDRHLGAADLKLGWLSQGLVDNLVQSTGQRRRWPERMVLHGLLAVGLGRLAVAARAASGREVSPDEMLGQLAADLRADGVFDGKGAKGRKLGFLGFALDVDTTRFELVDKLLSFVRSGKNESGLRIEDLRRWLTRMSTDDSALYGGKTGRKPPIGAPVIKIESPAPGAPQNKTFRISAAAKSESRLVTFSILRPTRGLEEVRCDAGSGSCSARVVVGSGGHGDGELVIEFLARNELNFETRKSRSVKIDTEAPELSLKLTPVKDKGGVSSDSGTGRQYVGGQVRALISAKDRGTVTALSAQGDWKGSAPSGSNQLKLTLDTARRNGKTILTAVARDDAGNSGRKSFQLWADNKAPALWSDLKPPDNKEVCTAADSFTASGRVADPPSGAAPGSGVDMILLGVWDEQGKSISGPTPFQVNGGAFSATFSLPDRDGLFKSSVKAVDLVGNQTAVFSRYRFAVRRDRQGPSIKLSSPRQKGLIGGKVLVVLKGEDICEMRSLRLDGHSCSPVIIGETARLSCPVVTRQDGELSLRAVAEDKLGNSSQKNLVFTVDNTSPRITVASAKEVGASSKLLHQPKLGLYFIRGKAEVRLVATDPNIAAVKAPAAIKQTSRRTAKDRIELLLQLDSATFKTNRLTLPIIASDVVGNSHTLKLDLVRDVNPPVLRLLMPRQGEILVKQKAEFMLKGSVTDPGVGKEPGSGAAQVKVGVCKKGRWDPGNVKTVKLSGSTFSETMKFSLGEGEYDFCVVASDRLGNEINIWYGNRFKLHVDRSPPMVTVLSVGYYDEEKVPFDYSKGHYSIPILGRPGGKDWIDLGATLIPGGASGKSPVLRKTVTELADLPEENPIEMVFSAKDAHKVTVRYRLAVKGGTRGNWRSVTSQPYRVGLTTDALSGLDKVSPKDELRLTVEVKDAAGNVNTMVFPFRLALIPPPLKLGNLVDASGRRSLSYYRLRPADGSHSTADKLHDAAEFPQGIRLLETTVENPHGISISFGPSSMRDRSCVGNDAVCAAKVKVTRQRGYHWHVFGAVKLKGNANACHPGQDGHYEEFAPPHICPKRTVTLAGKLPFRSDPPAEQQSRKLNLILRDTMGRYPTTGSGGLYLLSPKSKYTVILTIKALKDWKRAPKKISQISEIGVTSSRTHEILLRRYFGKNVNSAGEVFTLVQNIPPYMAWDYVEVEYEKRLNFQYDAFVRLHSRLSVGAASRPNATWRLWAGSGDAKNHDPNGYKK